MEDSSSCRSSANTPSSPLYARFAAIARPRFTNSSLNRRRSSGRSMTPWKTSKASTMGTTDQKIRARKVANPRHQPRRFGMRIGKLLEGVLDAERPDHVGAQAFVPVQRDLRIAVDEERAHRIPLEPERHVDDVIPDAVAVRLPAADDIGREREAWMQPRVDAHDVPQIIVLARAGGRLVAGVQG